MMWMHQLRNGKIKLDSNYTTIRNNTRHTVDLVIHNNVMRRLINLSRNVPSKVLKLFNLSPYKIVKLNHD